MARFLLSLLAFLRSRLLRLPGAKTHAASVVAWLRRPTSSSDPSSPLRKRSATFANMRTEEETRATVAAIMKPKQIFRVRPS